LRPGEIKKRDEETKQHWVDENELERPQKNCYDVTTIFFFHIQGNNWGLPHVASQGLLILGYWVTIQMILNSKP
jgi:hypothetical protein